MCDTSFDEPGDCSLYHCGNRDKEPFEPAVTAVTSPEGPTATEVTSDSSSVDDTADPNNDSNVNFTTLADVAPEDVTATEANNNPKGCHHNGSQHQHVTATDANIKSNDVTGTKANIDQKLVVAMEADPQPKEVTTTEANIKSKDVEADDDVDQEWTVIFLPGRALYLLETVHHACLSRTIRTFLPNDVVFLFCVHPESFMFLPSTLFVVCTKA